jgi:membrane protease YdiL (CAAX protease family)
LYGVLVIIGAAALGILAMVVARPLTRRLSRVRWRLDGRDLLVMAGLYVAVVGLFRLAFTVFTVEQTAGLFLSFAAALVLGLAGPVAYTVWIRKRFLSSLGIGRHNLARTLVLGGLFAGVQFLVTLWGYDLPRPVDWVPLLMMALVVGIFESVFFRGFIQGRLEAILGAGPAVFGAALLYALYHVGYGMDNGEMLFLFGLGIVYAIAYRLTENVLVLWPLLTPLGSFFAQSRRGTWQGSSRGHRSQALAMSSP